MKRSRCLAISLAAPWLALAAAVGVTLTRNADANSDQTPGPAIPAAAATPTPPRLRLGDAARPIRYAAQLKVVPTEEKFEGAIDIDLVTREPLPLLWLNAEDLTIVRAELSGSSGKVAVSAVPLAKDFVGFRFASTVPAGSYRLHIEYHGTLSSKDSSGAVRHKEGDDYYATTQFEPIDARRVFPCFDEPSFKVPWQLTLTVRSADQAFSNTRVLRESEAGSGMKRVEFAPTKPLPSYLVAWAVGPFAVVPAGKSARSGAVVRIITPRGQQAQASWAAKCTASILAALEEYFGINYPYEKLDIITVPMFGGAMEHPGLVTFDQTLLLSKVETDTISRKRAYAEVAAHELAHQWFGDLVTTGWWDDIWLNEAFATWMTPKIIERLYPSWGAPVERVQTRNGAMATDGLLTARKIRQPIESNNDIKNAFDGITYGKGASVIAMFERWLGAATFQKGVQRYLREHSHANATAGDFLKAISDEASKDITPAFSTFLEQPGVPLIGMELKCSAGKPASVLLSQERYLPQGSEGLAQRTAQLWQVPLCLRWKAGTAEGRACTLLAERTGELQLTGLLGCPDWVLPNEQAAGYYLTFLEGKLLPRLLADGGKQLTVEERIGAVNDMKALVRAGRIPYAEALALVPKLAQDKNRFVVELASGLVASLRDSQILAEAQRPAYARFIREVFGPQARRLSWTPRKGEDEDTRLLREVLLPLTADQGEDPELAAEARRLAEAWLKDRRAVDPDIVDGALRIAAKNGDRAFFDTLHKAAQKEQDRQQRNQLLDAMSAFSDRELVKSAMAIALSSDFELRESMSLIWGATRLPATRPLAYDFVKRHFDTLVDRLPRDSGAHFPFVGVALCDEPSRVDIETFFKERSLRFVGGPRLLSQALEGMRLCIAFRKSQTASVASFFSSLARH